MQYKVSTLQKSKDYGVSTLHSEKKVISFYNNPKTYEVNRTPVNVTINNNGDPLLEQRVTDLEDEEHILFNTLPILP